MLKKILLIFIFAASYVLANNYDLINNAYKQNTQLSKNEKKEKIDKSFKWDINFARQILKDFPFLMGVSEKYFNKTLERYINDPYWKKANELFYNKTTWKKLGKNRKIPKIKKVLKYLDLSAKQGNELAAFQGMVLIVKIFAGYIPVIPKYILKKIVKRKEINTYYKDFIDVLLSRNYCFAYDQALKYYAYVKTNIDRAYNIGLRGVKVCRQQLNKKKIPYWMDSAMRSDFVKFKTDFDLYHNSKYKASIEANRNLK